MQPAARACKKNQRGTDFHVAVAAPSVKGDWLHFRFLKMVPVPLLPGCSPLRFQISASTGLWFASGRIWRSCILRSTGSYSELFIYNSFLFASYAGGYCTIRPANSATSASPSPVTDAPIRHLRGTTRPHPICLFRIGTFLVHFPIKKNRPCKRGPTLLFINLINRLIRKPGPFSALLSKWAPPRKDRPQCRSPPP
ncbi:hypothetical protein SAMN05660706_11584 [Desulfoscipio geothermicus DSM 3669]|uniref:Uncharacterized protein n=1 Tax=Desulfoscipio geothermicus DSM 3669 TaxID=1121426 RepID=A0A1I6DRF4_9FIRM|nr:hypothetical protein SAMN05660706_11584 [Desulfoscipio geothermicus DSM 3669]